MIKINEPPQKTETDTATKKSKNRAVIPTLINLSIRYHKSK